MPETPRTCSCKPPVLDLDCPIHGEEAPFGTVEEAPVDIEIERLRKRTHEIAEAKDAEYAAVKRELGQLKSAVDQARERVKNWTADWTTDPRSQGPYGWWCYTSHNHAMEAVALVVERNEALAERDRMLDLLEAVKREIECPEDALRAGIPVYAAIRQCLREHGRLPKEA